MIGLPERLVAPAMSDAEAFAAFIGCWQLVLMGIYHPDGTADHPLGDGAVGQIMYSVDGHMSCHLMQANRPPLASYGLDHIPDADLGRAIRAYSGYFGTFTVDAAAGVVTHHVAGAWYPNMSGSDQPRRYAFVGDRLFLEAETGDDLVRIEWRRHVTEAARRLSEAGR